MGDRLYKAKKRLGMTTDHQEAMYEIKSLERMIKSQVQTAKKHRPKYTSMRKKAEVVRDAAEDQLRAAESPERRDELEEKIERLDNQVAKASKRVKSLDRRISKASGALDDLDFLRMDIELANDMDDIDYLERVKSMKGKITQDAHDEEMPGATFEAVCDEISSLAEKTGETQHPGFDETLLVDAEGSTESEEEEELTSGI